MVKKEDLEKVLGELNSQSDEKEFSILPASELLHLKSGDMLREMEQKLGSSLQRRFWYIFIVVAVLSFFGIQGLTFVFLNQQLSPQIDNAKSATITAETEIKNVRNKMDEVIKESDGAQKKVTASLKEAEDLLIDLKTRADSLDTRFKGIEASSANIRAQLELQITQLENRLLKLAEAVPVPEIQTEQKALVKEDETKLNEFKTNSLIQVHMYSYGNVVFAESEKVYEKLTQAGFKSTLTKLNEKIPNWTGMQSNQAKIAYVEKGRHKTTIITELIAENTDLNVIIKPEVLDDRFIGDIQLTITEPDSFSDEKE